MKTNKQKLVTGLFLIVLGIIIMSANHCQAQTKKVEAAKIDLSKSEQNELQDMTNQMHNAQRSYRTLDSLRQLFIRKKIYYSGYALNKVSNNGDSLQILPTSILLKLKK